MATDLLAITRACTKCGVAKPLDQFVKRPERKSGYYSSCRTCANDVTLAWRNKSRQDKAARRIPFTVELEPLAPEACPMAMRRCTKCNVLKHLSEFRRRGQSGNQSWCKGCGGRAAAASRLKSKPKPHKIDWHLRKKFNLTVERYDATMEIQGGACAFCGGVNPNGRRLAVDHDRKCCPGDKSCGKCLRWLLCGTCNTAMAQFRDSPALLRKVADMLENRSFTVVA